MPEDEGMCRLKDSFERCSLHSLVSSLLEGREGERTVGRREGRRYRGKGEGTDRGKM